MFCRARAPACHLLAPPLNISKQFENVKKNLMALEGDLGYLIAFSDFLGKKKKRKNKIDVRQESTIC